MGRAELDEAFGQIVAAAAEKVRPLGFVRRGSLLRMVKGGNSAVIQFQKSLASTKDRIRFTVNLAVICGALLEPHQPPVEKARSVDAHLHERIGALLPSRPDRWWDIDAAADAGTLVAEVSGLILAGAAYLLQYLDTGALAALWESGNAPGLTEVQRVRYLERLHAIRTGEA